MSILIKGMEMPISCDDCRFCGGIACTDCGPCAWCDVDGKARVADTRQNCPLVPVPPHGDLIDRREAIIDANERAYDFWLSDDEVNATIQFLKEQPTTIPAEEAKEP